MQLDDKDKIIVEKVKIIKQLQKLIELNDSECSRIILPHESAIKIYEIVNNNNKFRRPPALVLNHNGQSVTSVEQLI